MSSTQVIAAATLPCESLGVDDELAAIASGALCTPLRDRGMGGFFLKTSGAIYLACRCRLASKPLAIKEDHFPEARFGPVSVLPTYAWNENSAWGACTPAPLPASRRSTHFKPLGILKSPHATTACGAPSRSSDLNGQGRPPLQGGEGLNVV